MTLAVKMSNSVTELLLQRVLPAQKEMLTELLQQHSLFYPPSDFLVYTTMYTNTKSLLVMQICWLTRLRVPGVVGPKGSQVPACYSEKKGRNQLTQCTTALSLNQPRLTSLSEPVCPTSSPTAEHNPHLNYHKPKILIIVLIIIRICLLPHFVNSTSLCLDCDHVYTF